MPFVSAIGFDSPWKRNKGGSYGKAIPFKQQDFNSLRNTCRKNGSLFKDPTFPDDARSLGFNNLGPNSRKTRNVEWKRPTELVSKPQFIAGVANRTDVCQGKLGDCWLLAAIASLTLDQDLLARVVPPDQSFGHDYAGIFHFQFWQYGEWVDVVIDDRLPTRSGRLLFGHSADGIKFWSALLEKAYAKVNGCYEALSWGSSIKAFADFTGGISVSHDLSKAPPSMFKLIERTLGKGSLLSCSIAEETDNNTLLVHGHTYSITGAVEVHAGGATVELVRMRNPWGSGSEGWTGPWGKYSEEWDSVLPEEKIKLDHSVQRGEFWISYSDLLRQFSKMDICSLTPDTLVSQEARRWNYQYGGDWKTGATAGGCLNNKATYCSNPQFVIDLNDLDKNPHDGKEGSTIVVNLMQEHARREHRDLNSIGFSIYTIPDEYKGPARLGPDVLLSNEAVVSSVTYKCQREVSGRFKLPPRKYAIVPSTLEPYIEGAFILQVFTEVPLRESGASQEWTEDLE